MWTNAPVFRTQRHAVISKFQRRNLENRYFDIFPDDRHAFRYNFWQLETRKMVDEILELSVLQNVMVVVCLDGDRPWDVHSDARKYVEEVRGKLVWDFWKLVSELSTSSPLVGALWMSYSINAP